MARAITGTTSYYLAIPSIVLSDLSNTELSNPTAQSGNLVLDGKGNVPSTYLGKVAASSPTVTFSPMRQSNALASGSGIVAYASSGALDPAGATVLMNNLYAVYDTSNLKADSAGATQIAGFLGGGNGNAALTNLFNAAIKNSVGGGAVTIPSAAAGSNRMPAGITLDAGLSFGTLSNGNLTNAPLAYAPGKGGVANVAMSTGKWYWEVTC